VLQHYLLACNFFIKEVRKISLCPRGQENNDLFNYQFLNKLTREHRVLISEADMQGSRRWEPGQTHSPLITRSWPTMRLQQWPPFLWMIQKTSRWWRQ
jgi:hypothetical protein